MMSERSGLAKRFTRYGITGLVTNIVSYVLFLGLLWAGVPPVWATGLVYLAAVAASYTANYTWSFQSDAGHMTELPRYLFSYAVGLGVAMGSMALLSLWMPPALAQVLVIGLAAVAIFSCLEVLKFGQGVRK